jgi:hypothetical protein
MLHDVSWCRLFVSRFLLYGELNPLNHYVQKNWNLFSVNVAMAATGLYQLSRKISQDYLSVPEAPLNKV